MRPGFSSTVLLLALSVGAGPLPARPLLPILPVPSALGAASLHAQDPPDLPASERSGTELPELARRVAAQWSRSEVGALVDLMSPRGIGFHDGQDGQVSLDPRKTLAALEDLLGRRRSVSCTVVRVTPATGATDRGSAELAWEAVAPGTSEVLRRTVFVGFAREEAGWRIYEIRILP